MKRFFPIALFLVCLCAVLMLLPAHAAEVDKLDLSQSTYLLEDAEGELTIDDVRTPEQASRFVLGSPKVGLTTSTYWMRLTVSNPSLTSTLWWFDTGNRRLVSIDLFAPDAAGRYIKQSASAALPYAARPLPTHDIVFPVELATQSDISLYLRVRSDDSVGILVSPRLWQPEAFRKAQNAEAANWFLYCGIAFALAIINGSIYLLARDKQYLLYACSVLSEVLLVSTARGGYGAAIEYFWPNLPNLHIALGSLSAAVTTSFVFSFGAFFTGMARQTPRLWRVLVWILAAALLFNFSLTALTLWHQADLVPWIHGLVRLWGALNVMAMVLGSGFWIYTALGGNRPALIVIGAFAPLTAAGVWISTMAARGGTSHAVVLMWASLFELVVMSFALAHRFHAEVKSRVAAQQSLVDTLKRAAVDLENKVSQRTAELKGEQVKTKELLTNILPNHVIDELAATGKVRPTEHKQTTILFTDLIGFTQASASMPAERMVSELNDIFAAFDDICREEGVEKIKTIGDSYMAVAGLSSDQADHAQRCTCVALRMRSFMSQRKEKSAFKWELRVGLHSGPAVSGVVGKHKYAFDIWGDSVNIASRMESSGEAGKVNVSAYTYDLIRNEFDCEYRGKVIAKGKGEVDMYFVVGMKA